MLLIFILLNSNLFAQTYPTSSGGDDDDYYITNVTFAGINNTSSNNGPGYEDYTSGIAASVTVGSTYTLSVTIHKKKHSYLHAWIDWNHDFDFTDTGEEYILATDVNDDGPHTVNITVPSGATLVSTRMRVTDKKDSAPLSDENPISKGEVEDYTVTIYAASVITDLFYYVSDGDNSLYTIDRTNGNCNLIGSTGVGSIEAIAMWPIPGNRILYAADAGNFGILNQSTGAFSLIGEIDGGSTANGANGAKTLNDVDGLAFDPLTGILWATERKSNSGDYDLLFQINPATGHFVADVFGTGVDYIVIDGVGVWDDVDDIAISSTTGEMYAVSNYNNGTSDQSLNINKYTGAITVIGNLTYNDVEGLGYHNDGTFWATEGDSNRFSQINPATGVMTQVKMPMLGGGDPEALAALIADLNTVSGRVFNDINLNGADNSEAAITGVTVLLYNDVNANQVLDGPDVLLQSTTTDGNGDYVFYYATTGNLITTVDLTTLPSGFALTTDNIEIASFTDNVNFGEVDSGNDFGAASGSDCDSDGIPDFTEGTTDSDGDGVQNQCDLDCDNDGILDNVEGTGDKDGDGIPNYLDLDSDNDGIPDAIEANSGAAPTGYNSSTGRITGSDTDSDGLLNSVDNAPTTQYGSGSTSNLPNPDSDIDGISDYKDLDSDNDGILDIIEAGGTDSNKDGRIDGFSDSNNDGYHDALTSSPLPIPNTDASTYETPNGQPLKPNYIDMDSDADGIDDTKEGLATCGIATPCYSIPSQVVDADNDGIINYWDITSGGTPITPYNKDGDSYPDYIDTDTDNDGSPDLIEGNDANNDNTADSSPSGNDADGNGIDDTFDNNCSGSTIINISASDYGEERVSDGNMDLTSSDLELLNDGSTNQIVGVHYGSINVPQGKTISTAYLQFQCDEVSTGSVTITIKGEDIDNALAFTTTAYDVSSRTQTSASVAWSPADWNTIGESGAAQRTGEIKTIIQEIVNRGGWNAGNSMAFIFSGPSGTRTAETNPTLHIEYAGIKYACGTNVPTQDEDADGEDDWRDGGNVITGRVYEDINTNGNDDSEPALANVTIKLYNDANGNGVIDGGDSYVESTTTDASGNYQFKYAATGHIITTVDLSTLPANYALTTDNVEVAYFTSLGQSDSGNDFGAATGADCDSDGIPDFFEGTADSDGDGVQNQCDLDSDNDGILDAVESTKDTDGDGIKDYLDLDSDNDGIPDAIEANYGVAPTGYSTSGRITGTDTDGDGLLNSVDNAPTTQYGTGSTSNLPNPDSDRDGVDDNCDLDSDNDGILDVTEAGGTDSNGDGKIDSFTDTNNDGYKDALTSSPLPIPNTDATSYETPNALSLRPNYIDMDSDADGIDDTKEGLATCGIGTPCYSVPSTLTDADGDGIIDHWDNSQGGTAITPYNKDADSYPDYIDTDTDNDGFSDLIEGNDANNDDVADSSPSGNDADGNGIDDTFDNVCSGAGSFYNTVSDYAEERVSDGDMYLTSTDLELVDDSDYHGLQEVGLQFVNVNLEQGAIITSAYIQFTSERVSTGAVSITIKGQDIDNAPGFTTTDYNLSSRTNTSASVAWTPADWNSVGASTANERTSDIKTIIQEIVNRGGWSSGNSIVITFTGSGERAAETNPVLYVEFAGVAYACGTNVPTQDEDLDGEDDWRDDFYEGGIPLPIELLSFTADVNNQEVDLKWQTASEINNDYFTVERSMDGENFEPLIIVKGAGNSNQIINYYEVDKDPYSGISYYRLKQTDFDGEFSYSQIISVNITKNNKDINIYPNPVSNNNLTLELYGFSETDEITVKISNSYGALIYSKSFDSSNNLKFEIPIKEITKISGIYMVTLISKESIISKKLIIN